MTRILNKLEIDNREIENLKRFFLTGLYCLGGQVVLFGIGSSLTNLV
ncbi:MAG: hypothetical protein V3R64_04585 [Sphingomonadales bacterium]